MARIAADLYLKRLEYIEGGRFKGLTAVYMNAIGEISGLRFDLVHIEAEQVAAALEKSAIDMVLFVSPGYTPCDICKNLVVSAPYYVGSTILVTRGASAIIFDRHKLDGKTAALKGGVAYENMLRHTFPAVRPYAGRSPVCAGPPQRRPRHRHRHRRSHAADHPRTLPQ